MQLSGLISLILSFTISGTYLASSLANEPLAPLPFEPRPSEPSPFESPPASPTASSPPPNARRPDIVMFYLDDFSPRPRMLWEDPERTPNLARFANKGIRFSNAIVSTPLCGPSRSGLMTGRYGHSTGVIGNDAAPYRADNDIAEKLSKVGYRTVFVGKHLNRLEDAHPTRTSMEGLAENWDEFDVMWEDQGKFYDWTQYRKDDTVYYGADPDDHSSRVAAERAVQHIKDTPADQPLLLLISLVDGHVPITPMARHLGDPACESVEPWSGPAFNEDDVSDKPAHIQATPKLAISSYDLRPRCQQLLTVDWVVGKVTRALRETGRLDDTLQILTADNGWLMGDHRIVGKSYPYATAVPTYVRWPAELGTEKRVIEEPVTNLDWLPTICELAGCGVPHVDGMSLVPMITGKADRLDRKFLFFELLYDNARYPEDPRARPAYTGVESTLGYSDTLWAFTRYSSGESELYNLTEDPNQLENLSGKKQYAKIERDMQRFHKSVRQADRVEWQPTPLFE